MQDMWILLRLPERHHCGEKKCKTCGFYYKVQTGRYHQCFITKLKVMPTADVIESNCEEEDNMVVMMIQMKLMNMKVEKKVKAEQKR